MKQILTLVCIGTLTLAVSGWSEEVKTVAAKGHPASVSRGAPARFNRTVGSSRLNSSRSISSAQFRQRSYRVTPHISNNAVVHHNTVQSGRVRTLSQYRGQTSASQVRNNVTFNRGNNFAVARQRNVTINNNWRGQRFSGQNYAAFRNYHREWHNRDWWRHNHTRIIFVSGGWYYWDTGYWYPAWGYDPYASYYPYDGPIYGYNDLSPDQVIVNVQLQLQRDGYYAGPIDGVLGPMTRQALAAFQADRGLAVTSAVDEPTLATLGLT
jgi:hypothetical protein